MSVRDIIQSAAGLGGDNLYVEDVFSTYLYTGNGSTQTINNGIDLAGEGGLVWVKCRSSGDSVDSHYLTDTVRGNQQLLVSNLNTAQFVGFTTCITAFNADGFSLGSDPGFNASTKTYASWTFRKAPKFFDVVTYTGTGANRTVAHNLGSVPGMIIVKRTDSTADWQVYHRSNANTEYMVLNSTAAKATGTTRWNSTTPTDSVFSLGTDATVNASGGSYVAYLFAHDAGGFGDTGDESVVACGSFTASASGTLGQVDLGWEPQYLMYKRTDDAGDWYIVDIMRGMSLTSSQWVYANTSNAEIGPGAGNWAVNATGFSSGTNAPYFPNGTYIYLAIRRGPMKKPESGTEVFSATTYTGNGVSGRVIDTTITPDLYINQRRQAQRSNWNDRLRGSNLALFSSETSGELDATFWLLLDQQNGLRTPSFGSNDTGNTYINWAFRRAPGFFDVVCYTGTVASAGGTQTVAHNLGAVPELMICKVRNAFGWWSVYSSALGNTKFMALQFADSAYTDGANGRQWGNTTPTSTQFTVGFDTAGSGATHVAYLFASLPGVSKVGSYTGTGTTQDINCGFTTGARFVLIKRTDSTGDWYVWDTARGIVSGNDPYLLLNSSAAEVTNTDYIDPLASGFQISSTAPAAINASGGSFIFLAIA